MIETNCFREKVIEKLIGKTYQNYASNKLDRVADVLMGQSPKSDALNQSVEGIEFHQGKVFFGKELLANSPIYTNQPTKIVDKDAVLVCMRAPVGDVNIVDRVICIGRGLSAIIPRDRIDLKFLYYVMIYNKETIKSKSSGTTFSAITKQVLLEIQFPLPPLEEQKRIVAKIEELFAKIDEIDKAQKELKELAELAEKKVLDMAVRGELSYARPGDSNVDDMLSVLRNKKEVGIRNGSIKLEKPYNTSREFELKPFEIPSYWRFERLGSISINLDNFRIPLKNQERQKMNNKHFPYYGASGIIDKVDDYLFDKKLLLVSEDGANLLSRSSPIAFTASGKYWVNNHAHVLDTTEEIDKDYLCCYLESISIAPYVTGSAQPKITQANLNAIWVPVPPIEEQSRIATTVSLFRAQFSTINS